MNICDLSIQKSTDELTFFHTSLSFYWKNAKANG